MEGDSSDVINWYSDPSMLYSTVCFESTQDGKVRRATWTIQNEERWSDYMSLRSLVLRCAENAVEACASVDKKSEERLVVTGEGMLTTKEERYYLALYGLPLRLGSADVLSRSDMSEKDPLLPVEKREGKKSKKKRRKKKRKRNEMEEKESESEEKQEGKEEGESKQKAKNEDKEEGARACAVTAAEETAPIVLEGAEGEAGESDSDDGPPQEISSKKVESAGEEKEGTERDEDMEGEKEKTLCIPDSSTPVSSVEWTEELAVEYSKSTCPHIKYWLQRYQYFPWFDKGALLDSEGWYSVTPQTISLHMASRCSSAIAVDFFCGNGGSAIGLAQTCDFVIAVDIDSGRIQRAQHNAKLAGVDHKIAFVNGDVTQAAIKVKADVVVLSPPWGGMDYMGGGAEYDLYNMEPPLDAVLKQAFALADNAVVLLPKNTSSRHIRELGSMFGVARIEVEEHFLNNGCKSIAVYFGDGFDYDHIL